jgi:hypothetical protein
LLNHTKINPAICGNMGGTGGPYGRWNKPGIERQVLPVLTHMWKPKMLLHERREWVLEVRGREDQGASDDRNQKTATQEK